MKTKLLFAAVCLLCACSGTIEKHDFIKSVELTSPTIVSDTITKTYSGEIQENSSISLGFKVAGQIRQIYFKEGDHVRKGQLLAELDDTDYKLGVEALQIQYDQVKDEVERTEKLYRQKSISVNDYEKATAGLRQLEIQLEANKNKLKYTRLYAPVEGYIQSVNFDCNEMVDAGTCLFELIDVRHMEVVTDIPVSQYQDKDNIIGIYCRSTYSGNREIPMTLTSITPKADGNQLYQMKLTFGENTDKALTAGMNIEILVKSKSGNGNDVMTLTPHAIFYENEQPYVWTVTRDTTVSKKAITIGGIDKLGNVIISEGVTAGEQIVKSGVGHLHENEKVKIIAQPAKTNIGGLI